MNNETAISFVLLIIHPSTSLRFLLLYFPKPRRQDRILKYRKWPI